jgi:hypothetical protein
LEHTSEREYIVQVKGSLERTTPSGIGHDGALDPSNMARLDGEDGSCSGQVGGVGDVFGGTEVSCNADTFEDGGEGGKGLWIGIRERVIAWFRGGVSECSSEERDVRGFVICDLLESVADPGLVTCSLECSGVKLCEGTRVWKTRSVSE